MTRKKQQLHIEKHVCIGLTLVSMLLFISYIYLISASVVHVVIRTEVNQETQKISSEISLLEGRFIEAQYKVIADIASLQGYTQTSKKMFIDRTEPSLVLSDGSAR
ncbi:MAG: hypothetical protein ACI92I_000903 [Acidimicrobiales bacterium]|jgi:hypothetical protein